jgi:hypothetical protein
MSDNRDVARTLLTEAGRTILKDRPGIHGSAENSFQMIADFWTVHTRHLRKVRGHDNLMPEDVAEMMTMLKKARKIYGASTNADNDVDDIGYAALAGMLRLPDPSKNPEEERQEDIAKGIADVTIRQPQSKIDTRSIAERAAEAAASELEKNDHA